MANSTTWANNKKLRYFLVAVIWLSVWEIISLLINESVVFVSPVDTFLCLKDMVVTKGYWTIIFSSIARVLGGFAVGYILASIMALASHRFDFFRLLVSPIISVLKSTPVASFIIIALMWIGKDFVPVFICLIMVIPIVWSNVLEGLKSVDSSLLEMAKVFNMSGMTKLKKIYFPSLMPYNTAAIGSSLGLCWKAGIAAEVICRTLPSIGNSIWETKFYIETAQMFAWTCTVVLLSVIFDMVIKRLSVRLMDKFGYASGNV